MTQFVNSFGVLISALLGMGTILFQMQRALRKLVDFYQFAIRAERTLISIDDKLTAHLEGHP